LYIRGNDEDAVATSKVNAAVKAPEPELGCSRV